MTTTIIVQARMGSTRLPGKVLKRVLNKPLLAHQVHRLQQVPNSNLVIATSDKAVDDPIAAFCLECDLNIFRGSEGDVLDRFYAAACQFEADPIVRVTGDCPVIDPNVVGRAVESFFSSECDYASNVLKRSYPRGMDVEVFSFEALEKAAQEAEDSFDREHVTPFLYRRPDRFQLANFTYDVDESSHRWTVDTEDDLRLVKKIISALSPQDPLFSLEDMLHLLQENPEWSVLNAHVEQK